MQLARKLSSNKAHPDVWREIEQNDKAAIEKLSSLDFAGAITAYQGIARKLKPIVPYGAVQVEVDVPEYAQSFYNEATKRVQIGDEAWQTVTEFPLQREYLPIKTHDVRLAVKGFRVEPAATSVTVRDGRSETARFALTPEPAHLTVQANVSGAEVFDASGIRLGAAGDPLDVPSLQELALIVQASGYRPRTEHISAIAPGKTYSYRTVLEDQRGTLHIDVDVPEYAQSFYSGATKRLQIGDEAWQTHAAFPIKQENLLATSHEVRLQVSGFRAAPSTARATVRDGQTETVRFTLTPEPALVTVHANVPGAEVFDASGARLGAVGSPIEFPSRRELTITLRAAGFVDKTEQIEALDSGKTYTYRLILEKAQIPKDGHNWVSPTTGMEFVWIEALKIWVGKYEVTNGEYRRKEAGRGSASFRDHNLNGDRQPVAYLNFNDAKVYAAWLTKRDKMQLGVLRYRLPSEQEFMTYAQCGDERRFPWGNDWPPRSGRAGNYSGQESFIYEKIPGYDDSHVVTCNVEQSWANPWGLYGVGGNLSEACSSDSSGGAFGAWRGASWSDHSEHDLWCRSSIDDTGTSSLSRQGFRLVLSR
jgi:site-specific DNA-cytosine methylase